MVWGVAEIDAVVSWWRTIRNCTETWAQSGEDHNCWYL